jgi:rifampicin phosphotransferase
VIAVKTWAPGSTPDVDRSGPEVVVRLGAAGSTAVELVGAKAASLARSGAAGLPVLPGFVLTTALDPTHLADGSGPQIEAIRAAWRHLSDDGRVPLVVRSSATKEDSESSSMAGLFVSKLDVRGWDAFLAAVDEVLASKDGLADGAAAEIEMAVLVQPYLVPAWGGVLFGADPLTERTDRMVISAVRGGPDRLVSGELDGWTATLTRTGRIIEGADGEHPDDAARRELTALATRLTDLAGRPQDIEWAIDDGGTVRLLQSRPITTLHGPVSGPIYGPGPLAETFPDPLAPLEEDLWLAPLRDGLRHALGLLGSAPAGQLRRAPLVISVGGRPAVDLVLLGTDPRRRSFLRKLDPRPGVRRLGAAWRVGRLTAALPDLAHDLIDDIDADLSAVPELEQLTDSQLVRILRNSVAALRALHGYEMLAGALLQSDPSVAAAGLALDALRAGTDDDASDVVARSPIVLALIPPRIPPAAGLPEVRDVPVSSRPSSAPASPTLEGVTREALRVRVRWVHELSARAAGELGARLARAGVLPDAEAIRYTRWEELQELTRTRLPFHPDGRPDAMRRTQLPGVFRLAADGTPVSAVTDGARATGTPVGGGRGRGVVRRDVADAAPGVVLVVQSLDPRLAPVIPRLAGLVAETGSPLSHLAILAREYGVPTVVGKAGAGDALHEGDIAEVDGTTGAVTVIEPATVREEEAA